MRVWAVTDPALVFWDAADYRGTFAARSLEEAQCFRGSQLLWTGQARLEGFQLISGLCIKLAMSRVSSQHLRSWQLTARGTPGAPQILFPKLCLASSQAKTFGKLGCWKIKKKNHFTVSGHLGEYFKGFLLLLLCLGCIRQQLSCAAAGVTGISMTAESLPKASYHPKIVWAGMTAPHSKGLLS